MIKLDLKNAISNKELATYVKRVKDIDLKMSREELPGSDFLGWLNLPSKPNKDEISRMKIYAKKL
jgi:hypothetical protein